MYFGGPPNQGNRTEYTRAVLVDTAVRKRGIETNSAHLFQHQGYATVKRVMKNGFPSGADSGERDE